MSELEKSLICPDCHKPMKLADPAKEVFWCTPCKRARVKEHMEPYVAPKRTIVAKFKRLPEEGK